MLGCIASTVAPNDRGDGINYIHALESRRRNPFVFFMLFTQAKVTAFDHSRHDNKHNVDVRKLPLGPTDKICQPDLKAGFFPRLPQQRLVEGFFGIDLSAWEIPLTWPEPGVGRPPNEEVPPLVIGNQCFD